MSFYEQLQERTADDRRRLVEQPVIHAALNGRIDRMTYLAFLHEAFHHVRHTVPLLMACGSRLPARLEWLRDAMAEYIDEERGHHEWVLNDITAVGGDADATRHGEPGFATEAMVAYAYYLVDRCNPVGFLGMVHVLEGTSIALADRAARTLGTSLGLPERAFSYLISHGSLDQDHVAFFRRLVDRLEMPADREAVVRASRAFYRLYGQVFASLPAPAGEHAA